MACAQLNLFKSHCSTVSTYPHCTDGMGSKVARVQVAHDKFFWTAPVAAMAVTSTAKGIAPKFLLLGTAAGQVLSLLS